LRKEMMMSNIREIGEVFRFGEVLEVLAPFEKCIVFEVLLDAEMVEVVRV